MAVVVMHHYCSCFSSKRLFVSAAATADVFAENGQKISREIVAMMTAGVISMQMFQSKEIDMDL